MTRSINNTTEIADLQAATNEKKQETQSHKDKIDNSSSIDAEKPDQNKIWRFIFPKWPLTRVTKQHKAKRGYF